ncbi:MAG: urate hydroxylase PuuD [Bdellovibrionia bacterium]
MDIAIFSLDGFMFLLRWLHLFFGVLWIGLLYYFNFVQGSFFAETDGPTKSNAIQKLVPRALWWFRWAAMYTMLTGLIYLATKAHLGGFGIFSTSYGIAILTGMTLGLFMWANVWFVIWPNQKIVIASATQAATGGSALPTAAPAGAKAGLASRTNTLFSIPMLFFMGAANHLPFNVNPNANLTILAIVLGLIILGIEFNALKGKPGPMTTVKGVITCGFILAAVLYFIVEILTK